MPVSNCHLLIKAIGWCATFSVPLNCLLFFLHIRAIFDSFKVMTALFAVLWLSTLGCAMTAPFSLEGIHIGTTKNCIDSDIKEFESAGLVAMAVNDTAVFLAITAKLLMHSLGNIWIDCLKIFFSGKGMGNVLRALLKTGQLYYLYVSFFHVILFLIGLFRAIVGLNIISAVIILAPSVPPIYRVMFTVPNIRKQPSPW